MIQIVKTLTATSLIAMCLTSDTASYATRVASLKLQVPRRAKCLSVNSAAFVNTGQKLQSWEYQRWIPLLVTLPSKSLKP